jgi:hypothetical protein
MTIAAAVMRQAADEGVSREPGIQDKDPQELEAFARERAWTPEYAPLP